jgi:hypothetical protein
MTISMVSFIIEIFNRKNDINFQTKIYIIYYVYFSIYDSTSKSLFLIKICNSSKYYLHNNTNTT